MAEPNEPTTEALGAVPKVLLSGERKLCLFVLSGPDKGAVFPVNPGRIVLGRSGAHSDLVVTGRGLSRAHASLEVTKDGTIRVCDLNSTNGVFVNGDKVQEAALKNGDTLALGPEVSLRLESSDASLQNLVQDMYQGATRDGLTGLLNRRSFLQRYEEEAAATRRHGFENCVALLDVDHFKSINDTHGHPAGDAVLVELARRLQEAVRAEDVVGRYGGEEFIMLIRHANLEGARVLMERIRASLAASTFTVPTPEGEKAIEVTASIGLSTMVGTTSPLQAADQALYQAKRSGRNRVAVAPQ